MLEVVCITFAFFLGLAVRQMGLPPLVGFLGAGFGLNAFGGWLGMPEETGYVLDHLAHLGVLLLLFTVGLKLKLKDLVQPQVIGGGLLHFGITVAIFAPSIYLFMDLPVKTALLLAIALAFSSTVLAAKVLEAKGELQALHGRIAIGILIIQDLIALGVLSVAGGHAPSIWAVLVFALPLLRPVLHWLLNLSGHDELLILMGMLLALVIGGMGFEVVGLSPEVGALVMGVLLSNNQRAQELSDSLWSLKEVFLVGFFLQIGMAGLPDMEALLFALAFAMILPLKGILFFFLLILFRLRGRNAFLGALSLTCYSEFGLIVAAGVLPEWLVPLAITVAVSFVIAAPLNRFAHPLFECFEDFLVRYEQKQHHPDEQPTSLGDARMMIMGMGRIGTGAYDFLARSKDQLIGLDANPAKVEEHIGKGRNVVYADAEDSCFWHNVDLSNIHAVILAMDNIDAKLMAARQLRKLGFSGLIVAHAMHEDEAEQIREAGADQSYLTMTEAGVGLGEHTWEALHGSRDDSQPAT